MHWKPRKITVEKSVAGKPLTEKILLKFKGANVELADEIKINRSDFKPDELIIAKQKGKFIKKCPGTPGYLCCDYYVLNLGIGCFYNCTYCFLHHYMNSPFIVYANTSDLIHEIRQFCLQRSNKILRLGSGEFIDSLGFNELTDLNQELISNLSRIPNILFEIKTKSSKVDHLLDLAHNGRVVVSWSVNTTKVISEDEGSADSLKDRIEAARQCQEAGYKIGLHFDPLIYYPGWQNDYRQVVDLILENISPQNIAWISLGALRFNPALKPIIKDKFPGSRIIYEEMITGLDGKLRYFIAVRKKMFKTLMSYIRTYSEDVPVYLCMENKELAKEVGAIPGFSLNS